MRIGLAQLNSTVGDLAGNAEKILRAVEKASSESCSLLIFPEMVLPGYPAEDLILKPSFVRANLAQLQILAKQIKSLVAVVGFINLDHGKLYNAAAWIENGKIQKIYHKQQLPNYGVFDEQRYFSAGEEACVRIIDGLRVGITICEDIWVGPQALSSLKKLKPDIVINLSASPFHVGKLKSRQRAATTASKFLKAPLFYCNLIGGQDELVFDGGSFVVNQQGHLTQQFPQFEENIFMVDVAKEKRKILIPSQKKSLPKMTGVEEIYHALIWGLRDYVEKNGFKKVALGVSGGIDSALVAALATEALGANRVAGVTMPSQFNSTETIADSYLLAKNLGIKLLEIPIRTLYDKMCATLAPTFSGLQPDVTEENIQARIRGNLMMALSNKLQWLILTTGNKSEISTGYCTLYGDTAGGFAVIKDVLKTTVYDLSRFINKKANKELIPVSIINRPPTAELRDNQKDEDSLGSYAQLDPIIEAYIEKNLSAEQIIKITKTDAQHVRRIINLIDRNEYKRRQAPPGIKITPRSFGRDHRMPITNRFRQP